MLLHIETTIHNQIFRFSVLGGQRHYFHWITPFLGHSWLDVGKIWGSPPFFRSKDWNNQQKHGPALSDTWLIFPFARVGARWVTMLDAWRHFPSGQTGNSLRRFSPPPSSSEPWLPHCDHLDVYPASQFRPLRGPQALAAPQSLLCSASSK